MREHLKRELNKTYLILSSEGSDYQESYETEMIIKNSPETILSLHALRMDGMVELYYDISSKQTLFSCAERAKLSGDTIRSLFQTIDNLIKEMKDYLLDMESVLLDLEHIYTKEGKFYFCYCPWEKQDVLTSFRAMLEEILGNLDYHDTKGVELAYHLYQSACKGNFHISEILEEHQKEEKASRDETFDFYFQEAQEAEADYMPEQETVKESQEKKYGFFRKVLQFFLKKKEREEIKEDYKKDLEFSHDEIYQEFFAEQKNVFDYTEILESKSTNTILLENMPFGSWKLRPLLSGYEEFEITGDSFLVGKKRDSVDGFIGRDTISRIHSRLYTRQDRLFIADANSTNGTFVNGNEVLPGEDVEIFPGDRILFADVGYECYNSH